MVHTADSSDADGNCMTDIPVDDADATPGDWVTVSDAAERARVDTSTVRHWYRTGRLPTHRSEGERGAFLVPMDTVLALAARIGDEEDDMAARAGEMDASYWAMQTEAAREEASVSRQESADARSRLGEIESQLGFLRSQLAEMSEENRNLREQLETTTAALAAATHDVEQLRGESASVASITDFSWLDRTKAYESPVRPQQRLGANSLSNLLADAQSDTDRRTDVDGPGVGPSTIVHRSVTGALSTDESNYPGAGQEEATAPALLPEHSYGGHEDDLIPEPDKKRRRG